MDFGSVRIFTMSYRLELGVGSEHRSLNNNKLLQMEGLL